MWKDGHIVELFKEVSKQQYIELKSEIREREWVEGLRTKETGRFFQGNILFKTWYF